jgi:chorismate mutase
VTSEDIELLRTRIEELDAAIIRLIGERFAHVRLLGRAKALAGQAVEDPERENELRSLYVQAAQREGLDPAFVLRLFETVLAHSRATQHAENRRPKTA